MKVLIKKNPDDYYKQFPDYIKPYYDTDFFKKEINILKKELAKIGVLFYYLKWDKRSLYAGHHDYIQELIHKELDKHFDKYFNGYIYYSDALLYWNSHKKINKKYDGKIYISFVVKKNIIDKVNIILKQIFEKRTLGITSLSDAIVIYMEEQNKIIKIKEHNMWVLNIIFKNKKFEISDKDAIDIGNNIWKKIGNKYINDLRDVYSFKGNLQLFYEIYNGEIKNFVEKVKKLKLEKIGDIDIISIYRGDVTKITERYEWKY
jgi:hypothetical protein